MKVLIVVTHLLGTGHLARAAVLGRAFSDAGHHVAIASGGMPAPHIKTTGVQLVQLPPLRSDGVNFTRLLNANGLPADTELFEERQKLLLHVLQTEQPDVIITELFPFGRRVLRDEFIALLKKAQMLERPPKICASIRDILAPPSKPAKADVTHDIISQYYDAVLVHSDPEIMPLDLSWPVAPGIASKLRYTGFVANPPPLQHPEQAGQNEILVSAGGGDVGAALFETAINAANLDTERNWRILVGGADPQARCAHLRKHAGQNTIIEPVRPDFRQMLWHATASVSMCGYNTAIDLLQTAVPALLVPFDDGGEVEQSLRSKALAMQSGISVLTTTQMTPEEMLEKINTVTRAPKRQPRKVGLDGATQSVRIVQSLINSGAS